MCTVKSHPLPDFNPLTPTVIIWVQRQSARMSKITNNGLTRSGNDAFRNCTHMATVGVKGLNDLVNE